MNGVAPSGLAGQTVQLWREAPAWRYLTISAVVATVLAATGGGGGGGSGAGGGAVPPPSARVAPGAGAVIQPVAPVDQVSLARLQTFETRYQQVKGEPLEGVKCEELAAALQRLGPEDRPSASTAQTVALGEAERCQDRIRDSDARWSTLVEASRGQEGEAGRTLALANAARSITAFDKTRALRADQRAALQAGDRAMAELAASDKRLSVLEDAATSFSAKDAATYSRLVSAWEGVTELDRSRMTAGQARAFEAGTAAAGVLAESRARLSEALTAIAGLQASDSPVTRAALLAALPRVTEFDLVLADAAQRQVLDRGRAELRRVSLQQLVATAQSYRQEPSTEARESLATLARLLGQVDGSALSPEQGDALTVAREAASAVGASDQRISALEEAAQAWRKGRTGSAARMVTRAFETLTDFDRGRLGPTGNSAFEEVQRAYLIVQGPKQAVTPESKRQLAVSVEAADPSAADAFQKALRRAGWPLAAARADAALVARVDAAILGQGRTRVGAVEVESARTQLTATVKWAFTDEQLFYATAEGNGVGSSNAVAVEKSNERAAGKLVETFDAQVVK